MLNQFDAMGDPPVFGQPITVYYDIHKFNPSNTLGYTALFFIGFFGLAYITMSVRKYQDR